MHPDAQDGTRLDRLFIALADANRRAMIDRLSAKPASVSELAHQLDMALPSALKHLAVLEAGGLVRSDKAGRVRTFHMAPNAFQGLEAWLAKRKAAASTACPWNSARRGSRIDRDPARTSSRPGDTKCQIAA